MKFGISPFGIWRNEAADPLGSETNGLQSYEANLADTRKWVKEEWIDYILPQIYWNIGLPVADYAKLVPWWSDVVAGTRVQLYIGQADYKIGLTGQPAAHLVATLRAAGDGEQSFVDATAEPGEAYTYYVSAVDRLWNESDPSPPRFVR